MRHSTALDVLPPPYSNCPFHSDTAQVHHGVARQATPTRRSLDLRQLSLLDLTRSHPRTFRLTFVQGRHALPWWPNQGPVSAGRGYVGWLICCGVWRR